MGSTPIPFRHPPVSRKKKKKKAYDPATQARRMARALLGPPPAERVLSDKRRKPSKHKRRELEREMEY